MKPKPKPNLKRRPLRTIDLDAGKPYGSPSYLGPPVNAGGTTREIPVTNYVTNIVRRPG